MASEGIRYAQNVGRQFSNNSVGWPKRFLSFGILLFTLVLFVYLGLSIGYENFLRGSIDRIEGEIGELSSQISDTQKEDLAILYSQVTNIKGLLRNHTAASNAFSMLEAITSENVAYTNFALSVNQKDVAIEGIAGTYDDLVSQLALFEEAPEIEKVLLEESEFQNGVIRFQINVTLADGVLTARGL